MPNCWVASSLRIPPSQWIYGSIHEETRRKELVRSLYQPLRGSKQILLQHSASPSPRLSPIQVANGAQTGSRNRPFPGYVYSDLCKNCYQLLRLLINIIISIYTNIINYCFVTIDIVIIKFIWKKKTNRINILHANTKTVKKVYITDEVW